MEEYLREEIAKWRSTLELDYYDDRIEDEILGSVLDIMDNFIGEEN